MPVYREKGNRRTYTYTVEYAMQACAMPKSVDVVACDKWDAYDRAVYEVIPAVENKMPYAAWVAAVTYHNGTQKRFNTFMGKPI